MGNHRLPEPDPSCLLHAGSNLAAAGAQCVPRTGSQQDPAMSPGERPRWQEAQGPPFHLHAGQAFPGHCLQGLPLLILAISVQQPRGAGAAAFFQARLTAPGEGAAGLTKLPPTLLAMGGLGRGDAPL